MTTEKATYYRAEAWASQQRLLYEAAIGEKSAPDGLNLAGRAPLSRPLAAATALLGLEGMPDRGAIIAAFRRRAKQAHPDGGGDPQLFKQLIEARDLLLKESGEQ